MLSTSIGEDDHHIGKWQNFHSYLIVKFDGEIVVIQASESFELNIDVVAHNEGTKVVIQLVIREFLDIFLIILEDLTIYRIYNWS